MMKLKLYVVLVVFLCAGLAAVRPCYAASFGTAPPTSITLVTGTQAADKLAASNGADTYSDPVDIQCTAQGNASAVQIKADGSFFSAPTGGNSGKSTSDIEWSTTQNGTYTPLSTTYANVYTSPSNNQTLHIWLRVKLRLSDTVQSETNDLYRLTSAANNRISWNVP